MSQYYPVVQLYTSKGMFLHSLAPFHYENSCLIVRFTDWALWPVATEWYRDIGLSASNVITYHTANNKLLTCDL
jgi:hypothetical protein